MLSFVEMICEKITNNKLITEIEVFFKTIYKHVFNLILSDVCFVVLVDVNKVEDELKKTQTRKRTECSLLSIAKILLHFFNRQKRNQLDIRINVNETKRVFSLVAPLGFLNCQDR